MKKTWAVFTTGLELEETIDEIKSHKFEVDDVHELNEIELLMLGAPRTDTSEIGGLYYVAFNATDSEYEAYVNGQGLTKIF